MRGIAWSSIVALGLVLVLSACSGSKGANGPVGRSTLHEAAARGDSRAVTLLIDEKANVNAKDSEGCTPLHLAALADSSGVVGILLEAGADPTIADSKGRTPADAAQQEGKLRALAALQKGESREK